MGNRPDFKSGSPPGIPPPRKWFKIISACALILHGSALPYLPGIGTLFADDAQKHKHITVTVTVSANVITPSGISNLTALATAQEGEILLSWTAPGEFGMSGLADNYVVKYSTSQITTALFDAASAYAQTWAPAPAGLAESHIVSGLTPRTTYYFAIKARNFLGNSSVWTSTFDDPAVNTTNFASALEIPPANVNDLSASPSPLGSSACLDWTAVGDDGLSGQLNGRYRVNYSTDAAAPHLLDPAVYQIEFSTTANPGTSQRTCIGGLTVGSTYYFRLVTLDERANASDVSNAASALINRPLDTIPPRVYGFSPTSTFEGVIPSDVSPDSTITITFDEAMDSASLVDAFRLRAIRDRMGLEVDQTIGGTFSFSALTMTFMPGGSLRENETYEISLTTGATDLAGNPLAEPLSEQFRTIFNHAVENVIYASDGRTRVRIPPGCLPDDGFLRISTDPVKTSFGSVSGLIREANEKIRAHPGGMIPLPETIREFELVSTKTGQKMNADLKKPMDLFLPYDESGHAGYVQGPNYRVHERFLGIVHLDEDAGLWTIVPGYEVNKEERLVTVKVPHFSAYAVMPVATGFVGDAFAYPVPFVPSQGHSFITFNNLSTLAKVRIYTVAGELVREMTEEDGDGQMQWDVKNDQAENIISGVYIYVIKSGSDKKVGRLVIIR